MPLLRCLLALSLLGSFAVAGCSKTRKVTILGTGGELTPTEQEEVESNVADVYFGDALPAPTRVTGIEDAIAIRGLFLAADGDRPSWLKDDVEAGRTLYPAFDGQGDGAGTFTVKDPIVPPATGTFRLYVPGKFTTKPFTVTGRQPAYVQCLDANVLAGAARQDPPSTRARLGACTMTRGGGDTVGKIIQHASCTSAKGRSDCEYAAGVQACTGAAAPQAQRRAPGDAVMLSWDGGDVPAGSATATLPPTIEIGALPTQHSMADDLEVTFTGGAAGGTLRMTIVQMTTSTVTIDCDVDAASGKVTIPKAALVLLEPGLARLIFTNLGVQHVHLGEWDVEASAMGLVTKGGVPLSLAADVELQAR
jgi:hypothetical protein